jgi:ribose transport system permease protein
MKDLRLRLSQNLGLVLAVVLFLVFYLVYNEMHPRGFSSDVLVANANEAFAIVMVAMAQTVPVLMGGLDLSVGATMTMVNCLASGLLNGSPLQIVGAMVLCLLVGALAGLINGCVVVYGRIQPIIATLATGAIYIGIALFLRPTPGGSVDDDLAWAMSNNLHEMAATFHFAQEGDAAWLQPIAWMPVPLLLGILVVLLVWLPFRASVTGRGVYAIGSSEGAAYMSGVAIDRSKLAAFVLGGFFAGVGGLYLTLQTSSGNADIQQAGGYTLNSIAAVVIGGTSLMGGSGGAIASAIGALVIRAISFNFRIFNVAPLLQPLIEGAVLLAAVSLGAIRILRIKNRLELFG